MYVLLRAESSTLSEHFNFRRFLTMRKSIGFREMIAALCLLASVCVVSVVGVVLLVVFNFIKLNKIKGKPSPPFTATTLFQNIRAAYVNKGLYKLKREQNYFSSIDANSFGGNVRLAVPFWQPFFLTSDYVLARMILNGDAEKGVREGEKTDLIRVVNTFVIY